MRWRDTTFLPPFSAVRIWIRFAADVPNKWNGFVGKSVYHCHFLTHEDAGMIQYMRVTGDLDGLRKAMAGKLDAMPSAAEEVK